MKTNMCKFERIIRVILSLLIFTLYFSEIIDGKLGFIAIGTALIMLVTGLFRFCPLYTILGLRKCTGKPCEIDKKTI